MSGSYLYIVLGFLVIVVVVYLLIRLKLLPEKALRYVVSAIGVVAGIAFFKNRRGNKAKRAIKKTKQEIGEQKKKLDKAKERYEVGKQKLYVMETAFEQTRAANKEKMNSIDIETNAEKKRIDNLKDEEIFNEF
ncbi:MAG: hypothetical protein KAW12_23160 [Candidatus Aminicenantes bacterium]|nr:hypothetical protein [Candidatus Aminicenantes bacterium]